jgi:amidophosphoribosyltransferase
MSACKGGYYAGMYLINGVGLVGFRDPHGIRPMVIGERRGKKGGKDFCMASESVAIILWDSSCHGDIQAGEAFFVDMETHKCVSRLCATPDATCHPSPCIFEYVYLCSPRFYNGRRERLRITSQDGGEAGP